MKTKMFGKSIVTAVSILAMMASMPAFAQTKSTDDTSVSEAISEGTENIAEATDKAFEDIKAAFIDNDDKTEITEVTINPRTTVSGMIGRNINNDLGKKVGVVHDIILDKSGKATTVIVSDSDFFGGGKMAAFDYSLVALLNEDGDVISDLTQDIIDNAREFSYNTSDYSDSVGVIPTGSYSALKLLESQLVDSERKTVAEVDNIVLRNAKGYQLIVTFDQVVGMGGDKAALPYGDATIVADGENSYDFQLTADYAAQFETYKKSVK